MTAVPALKDFAAWTAEGHPQSIEYSVSVLSQIGTLVNDGYNRLRRGGIEVGGVLFGVRTDRGVKIQAYRPLECEYAFGPNFVLSEKDHAALTNLLERAPAEPRLQGLVPVGWYHSHTRSALHLSAQDVEIFNRHFPEPWQVALVLRPEKTGSTSAGFFFREADGSIHAESSYCEFPAPCGYLRPRRPVGVELAGPIPIPRPLAPPAPRRGGWKWMAFTAASAIALVCGYFAGSGVWRGAPVPLSLMVEERGGQLRITWDRAADSIRRAGGGSLDIIDGAVTTPVKLDGNELRTGAVLYARTSPHVIARMKVGSVEESATFIGQLPPAGDHTQIEPPAAAELEPPAPPLREQADQPEPGPPAGSRPEKPSQVKKPPAKIVFALNQRPKKSTSSPMPSLAPPPSIERIAAPAALPSALFENLAAAPAIQPPAVPAAARVTAAAPVPPRTGSFIWTGRITRNGVLTIDGSRPSTGALTGEVPGFPVRVRVYPADLTAEGLKVYTQDSALSEPPGPRNGWNRTSYVRDPKRARSVTVVEPPAEKNGWRRLVLRGEGSGVSLLLVEWSTIARP